MFTGIIQAVGSLVTTERRGDDSRLKVATGCLPLENVGLGDSIAVNGVCLTVTQLLTNGFWADVSVESLKRTTLGLLKTGVAVNLEKALTLSTPLGGHLVSGHVDGVGVVLSKEKEGRSVKYRVKTPASLTKYIVEKGSICVDGVSLTVNAIVDDVFNLNIVPHTTQGTIIDQYQAQSQVNLEIDLIARYVEKMMFKQQDESSQEGMTLSFLMQNGYMK